MKRPAGYFPEGGDWEYFVTDTTSTKLTEHGKLQHCAECHARQKDHEYLMRHAYLRDGRQLDDGKIVLHSSKVHIAPGAKKLLYEKPEKKNTLGYWVHQEDSAYWNFLLVKPRKFQVEVLQGCGKGSGGSQVEIAVDDSKLVFAVEDTGHFQNFKSRHIGTLELKTPGQQKLTIRALSKPGQAVMDLRQMVLHPITER
jgi:hypothetical protein